MKHETKVHMANYKDEARTLCGRKIRPEPLPTHTKTTKNPEGKGEVTCNNCLRIIQRSSGTWKKETTT